MGFRASIEKKLEKIFERILRVLGRCWSRYPYVEIFSVHLGHTIFESAHLLRHRPLNISWRNPMANRWLVRKLEESLPYPGLQKWAEKKIKGSHLAKKIQEKLNKNFSDQHFLMNLGFNCLPPDLPAIVLDKEEEESAEAFLREMGLEKQKYVCFCIRDESYYREFKPDLFFTKTESFEFRNAKIANYASAATYLKKKGLVPVLMGFTSSSIPEIFVQPARNRAYRPWIEAYLFQHCLFCVGMMTGTTLYASLFGRPVLWTDAFWRGAPIGARKDLVLPKNILSRRPACAPKKGGGMRELHMREWRRLGPPPDNDWTHFSQKGYETQACSSLEIKKAVEDMFLSLKAKKMFPSWEIRRLHREYSKLHFPESKRLGYPPTRLAPSWAMAHRDLILPKSTSHYEAHWMGGEAKDALDLRNLFCERKTRRMFLPKRKILPLLNFKK